MHNKIRDHRFSIFSDKNVVEHKRKMQNLRHDLCLIRPQFLQFYKDNAAFNICAAFYSSIQSHPNKACSKRKVN